MNSENCVVCNGEFHKGTLVNGKCSICKTAYPDANSLIEAIERHGKKQETLLNLTEDRVKILIYEILIDAGLTRKTCEVCNNLFFPRSPAQKTCQSCRDKNISEQKPL